MVIVYFYSLVSFGQLPMHLTSSVWKTTRDGYQHKFFIVSFYVWHVLSTHYTQRAHTTLAHSHSLDSIAFMQWHISILFPVHCETSERDWYKERWRKKKKKTRKKSLESIRVCVRRETKDDELNGYCVRAHILQTFISILILERKMNGASKKCLNSRRVAR